MLFEIKSWRDGKIIKAIESDSLSYNRGKIKRCLVKPGDFVVYPHDISKVRCREVEVIEEP